VEEIQEEEGGSGEVVEMEAKVEKVLKMEVARGCGGEVEVTV
jgi:hypothetical protein